MAKQLKTTRKKRAKGKSKLGRPTLYTIDNLLKKTQEYLDSCQDREVDVAESYNERTGTERTKKELRIKLPTVAGLSLHLHTSKQRIYEYSKRWPSFRDALAILSAMQEERLINESMAGRYNAAIAKLMLSTNHGYQEQSNSKWEGRITSSVSDEDKAILKKLLELNS